ncbi:MULTISPECIES: CoA transferase [unclassified Caballeronia]|uniref:CaiB/BaiF CoA transferase family protein n=1 Tax=unclassified Caballeronia TaxID=2646786 RepID=UPI00285C24BB|nr:MULTISPECIES: CoA transferase [unclassified Caballeronia]MDR5815890.1 CoA transferase [Caballeronia sp. LZ033]MDR5821908.1 CoA transferase [Caballeronia sp. LZ043]
MRQDLLKGIRFADLTWAGAGPFGTKVFSDFGAEVVKVESMTRPDSVRTAGPFKDGIAGTNRSGYFASRNTGKKSIAVDMKTPEGKQLVLDLIARSDVVTNNFGPGAMDRLGLGYDALKALKPDLIYLSMPMYGQDGPRASLLGVGMTISAVTGIMMHTAYDAAEPIGPGTHFPDHAANPYHAAFAVLAALRHRRKTGRGMKIDLSQVESTANFMGPLLVEAARSGKEPPTVGNRHRAHAPHNIFRCAGQDGWVAVSVLDDAQWRALAALIGATDLADDAALKHASGRLAQVDRVEAAVSAWTRDKQPAEAAALLRAAGVPAAAVASSRDLIEKDEQLAARDYWQHVPHPEVGPTLISSPPFLVDGARIALAPPPLFGQHTQQVLRDDLGLSPERIRELEEREVLK